MKRFILFIALLVCIQTQQGFAQSQRQPQPEGSLQLHEPQSTQALQPQPTQQPQQAQLPQQAQQPQQAHEPQPTQPTRLEEQTQKQYVLYFRHNSTAIDPKYMGNQASLDQMKRDVEAILAKEGNRMENIHLIATASPEGPVHINKRLAIQRSQQAKKVISKVFPMMPKDNILTGYRINDWSRVIMALENTPGIVHRAELLKILKDPKIKNKDAAIRQNKAAFEEIRYTLLGEDRTVAITITLYTGKVREQALADFVPTHTIDTRATEQTVKEPAVPLVQTDYPAPIQNPFYMGLKTNALYDLAAIPNIGVEFYLGNNWSLSGNYAHAWFRNSGNEWWYRIYGGEVALRKWFGRESIYKPLTGHHVGAYFQTYTFDFKFKNSLYGHLAEDMFIGGGVEYGYALPIARKFNLDFVIGIGYFGGEIKDYIPIDGHRVWQKTKNMQWFGPTKAEVSLVWLLGRGNENKNKGGRR